MKLSPLVIGIDIRPVLSRATGVGRTFRARRDSAMSMMSLEMKRSGCTESSPRLEGLKFRVLGEREGFLQITLASGLTGWVPRDQVERI